MEKICSCGSYRIASIFAKCSDRFHVKIKTIKSSVEHDGYVPRDLGIGGGDDVSIRYCLDCGQIQGDFPLPFSKLESSEDEGDDDF